MAVTIKQIVDAINQVVDSGASTADTLGEEIRAQERLNDVLERQKAIVEAKSDSDEKAKELKKIEIEQLEALQKRRESELRAAMDSNNVHANTIAAMEEEQLQRAKKIDKLKEDTNQIDKNTEASQKQKSAMDSLSGSISSQIEVYGKHNLVNTQSIETMIKTVHQAGLAGSAFAMLKGIVSGFINTTIAFTFSIDSANAAISKQTGLSRSNAAALTQNAQALAFFGVGASDLVSQVTTLVPLFTDFTRLSKNSQRDIAETGALLEKNGVSAQDFATGIQLSTKAMAMTSEQASATQRDLADFATIIGVTPQQMSADFAGAGASLAKFGSDGVRAFKDLAITSKATGLSIEKLLRVTEKFDTFEGAAEQAGMLNAALGGNFVNAMDLLMETDPASRFEMIRDAIMDTGLTFDDMSYFQRKFYAEAAGLDDVNDLALLMSGSFDGLAGSQQKSSAEILRLQERTKAFQDIGEKFKTLLMSLIPIFTPLIDKLTKFAGFLEKNKSLVKGLGTAFMIFAGVFVATKLVGTIVGMAKSMGLLAATQPPVTKGALKNAAAFAIQAVAVGALGVGLGMAFSGASDLVTAFKDVGDNAPYAIAAIVAVTASLVGAAFAVAGLGTASSSLIPFLVPLGVAIAAFGATMAIAGAAAKAFGEALSMMNAGVITSLTGLFLTLGTNATGIAASVVSLGLLTPVLFGLSAVIDGMNIEKLTLINSLFENLARVEFENIKSLRTEVEGMLTSINETPTINLGYVTQLVSGRAAEQFDFKAALQGKSPPVNVAAPNVNVEVFVDGKKITATAVTKVDEKLKAEGFGFGSMPN